MLPPPRASAASRRGRRRLPATRQWTAVVLALVGLPLLVLVLLPWRESLELTSVLLIFLLAVVLIAVVGGVPPSLTAAVAAVLLVNYFFVPPYGTLVVESRDNVVALAVFVAVAAVVSVVVEAGSRRRETAERIRLEAGVLSRAASEPVEPGSLRAVLDDVRRTFDMTTVALVDETTGEAVEQVGPDDASEPTVGVPAGDTLTLRAWGGPRFAVDPRPFRAMAAAAARAHETEQLAEQASRARELAEVDRLRSALLAAVGHDLRTPLAGVKAAVTSLRQHDVTWTDEERDELLETIEDSADRLDDLLSNLLALSRLQAGALVVDLRPVALDEVVARALLGGELGAVVLDVPDDLPLVSADPGLLERVVANLAGNACRYSPPGRPVTVTAHQVGSGWVDMQVVDHGPGVAAGRRDGMFTPFQRLDDRSHGGVGLGLAIARGFTEAMGGTIEPSDTAGGGLTMTVRLRVAA